MKGEPMKYRIQYLDGRKQEFVLPYHPHCDKVEPDDKAIEKTRELLQLPIGVELSVRVLQAAGVHLITRAHSWIFENAEDNVEERYRDIIAPNPLMDLRTATREEILKVAEQANYAFRDKECTEGEFWPAVRLKIGFHFIDKRGQKVHRRTGDYIMRSLAEPFVFGHCSYYVHEMGSLTTIHQSPQF